MLDCNCTSPIQSPCFQCGEQEHQCNCTTPIYTSDTCGNGGTTSDCVIIKNNSNTCLGIVKDATTLTTFINNLITYVKNIFSNLTSTSLTITPSGGVCNKTATIEIVPSTNPGNSFTLGSDGKAFTPKVEVVSGQCISFTKSLVNGVITYTPVINMDCLASLLCPMCNNTPGPQSCSIPTDLNIT